MDNITNTNHNIFTLTLHVVESLNKAAGKVDKKVYGDSIRAVEPTPKGQLGITIVGFVGGMLTIFILVLWMVNVQTKWDNVKKRIFR